MMRKGSNKNTVSKSARKHLVVIGDSFCSSPEGWPGHLANQLNLNLINFGDPGAHWWTQLYFLENEIPEEDKENIEVIVFCHTEMNRMPTRNREVTKVNRMNQKFFGNEVDKAVELYYKHISDWKFLDWAQNKWFEEIGQKWSHIPKIVHLHSFPWSWEKRELLKGMNVWPSLAALALNEVDAKGSNEIPITTPNHFNNDNNWILAKEVKRLIDDYSESDVEFNVSEFKQMTDRWLDWEKATSE